MIPTFLTLGAVGDTWDTTEITHRAQLLKTDEHDFTEMCACGCKSTLVTAWLPEQVPTLRTFLNPTVRTMSAVKTMDALLRTSHCGAAMALIVASTPACGPHTCALSRMLLQLFGHLSLFHGRFSV